MGIEFFQTGMGRTFFEGTLPRIASALERIADALEKQNARNEPPAPDPNKPAPGYIECDDCKAHIRDIASLRKAGLSIVSDEARAEHKTGCRFGGG